MSHTQSMQERGESTAELSMLNVDSAVEGNGIKIGFGKVEGFRPAQWPDEAGVKRFHLDQQVDDLDEAAESRCAIGASQPDFQPGAGRWRVLLDPDGQPFCLSPRPAALP